ncbi:MAG TPA: flippase-like domain-containing protein [Thermoanaerobaculia bacterium]|nr:flippase-like domain-containing protein [Thermoanaerobaculia bacterium]
MKTVQRVSLVLGVVLFAWLLARIGPATVARNLRQLGWGFGVIFLQEGLAILLYTLAWRRTLPPESRGIPMRSLFSMRLIGDAVNTLTPSAVVGGELLRVGLLKRFVPTSVALASVGLAALAQFMAQALFIVIGIPFVAAGGLRGRVAGAGYALAAVLLAVIASLVYLAWKGDGFRKAQRWLEARRWLPERWTSSDVQWAALDEEIFGALRRRPQDFLVALLFFYLGWSVTVADVYWILLFLGAPVSLAVAFSIAVLLVLIEGFFFFVPARAGIPEAASYAVFLALGLDPARGFALALARRLRELTWGLVGLAIVGSTGGLGTKDEGVR